MHSFAYPVAKLPHHIAKLTATRREIFFPRQPSPTNSSSSSSSRRSSSLLVVESRLFSNLGSNLQHEPGSVVGAATLVAGTAVGAGILALPAVCAPAGFAASAPTLIAAAGFSIITGLLVAEVCVNTMCEIGTSSGVSLGSMARRTLGEAGATAVSITYAVLHYSLLVACEFIYFFKQKERSQLKKKEKVTICFLDSSAAGQLDKLRLYLFGFLAVVC